MLAKMWLWELQVAVKQFVFSIFEERGSLQHRQEQEGAAWTGRLHVSETLSTMQLTELAKNSKNKDVGIKRKPSAGRLGQRNRNRGRD